VLDDLVFGYDQVAGFLRLGSVNDRVEPGRVTTFMVIFGHRAKQSAKFEQLVFAIERHRAIPMGFNEKFFG